MSAMLKALLYNAIGDVLLSAGVVAYMGAFTVDFRNVCIFLLAVNHNFI